MGVDYYYSCIGSEIKRGNGNQPLAISSIFGWILCGSNKTQKIIQTTLGEEIFVGRKFSRFGLKPPDFTFFVICQI